MTGASLIRGDSVHIPLRDESVDAVICSPPYFALRSYQDGGEHYDGQIGSEPTPQAFLEALWAVTAECKRVLKPSGSMFVNLGDKYSGSGGHNNSGLQDRYIERHCPSCGEVTARMRCNNDCGVTTKKIRSEHAAATRQAPDRYNQDSGGIPAKSLMLLPERYRIGAVDHLGLIARAVVIWDKPNGLPESVTDRVRRSHEDWVHLTKAPRYYAAVDEIREAYEWVDKPGRHNGSKVTTVVQPHDARDSRNDGLAIRPEPNPLGKLPGSVWRIPSEPLQVPEWVGVQHYAAFAQEWPRRLILGWTPPGYCCACGEARTAVVDKREVRLAERSATSIAGRVAGSVQGQSKQIADQAWMGTVETSITGYRCACPTPDAPTRPAVVLDPFSGTGTTTMVARALGRYGIGIDLSADYHRLATWRIWQSGHAAKTNQRTWAERQGALL